MLPPPMASPRCWPIRTVVTIYGRAIDEWTIRGPRRPIRSDSAVTDYNGPYEGPAATSAHRTLPFPRGRQLDRRTAARDRTRVAQTNKISIRCVCLAVTTAVTGLSVAIRRRPPWPISIHRYPPPPLAPRPRTSGAVTAEDARENARDRLWPSCDRSWADPISPRVAGRDRPGDPVRPRVQDRRSEAPAIV